MRILGYLCSTENLPKYLAVQNVIEAFLLILLFLKSVSFYSILST